MGGVADDSLWQLEAVSLEPRRLCNVTTRVRPGITAIIGWSGAGKTSLLNVLAGFEKPNAGEIRGTHVVGWVPQNGALWPHCTACEQIEIAAARKEEVTVLLEAFDLATLADALPADLSEGEQSRVAVARALASRAPVLVMDEPLVHVDTARAGKYWRVIQEHVCRTNASLVFSTHEPAVALGFGEHTICLHGGRVVCEGTVAELYANPSSEELMNYLGPGNWFTPEDALRWCDAPLVTARCFRPEQLAIVPDPGSPMMIEESQFVGAWESCRVRDESTGLERLFVHLPPLGTPPGTRIIVRVK
jgi:ABC-type sulfate/molybdate transport systems ATPase subunit